MIRKSRIGPRIKGVSPMSRLASVRNSVVTRMLAGVAVFLLGQPMFASAQSPGPTLQAAIDSLSETRMLADIRTLSDPTFNGRQTGTRDDLESAQWVAQAFVSAGMRLPLIHTNPPIVSPGGRKDTPVSMGMMTTLVPTSSMSSEPIVRIGTVHSLSAKQPGVDYLPIFDSPSADVQAPVIFVGYGIVDRAQGLDDYAGVDVTNCIVLFLRGKPDHYKQPISHAEKVRIAREHGAIGYLTVTGPVLNSYEVRRGVTGKPSAFYGQLPAAQALPGAWISTDVAQELLAGTKKDAPDRLRSLQEQLNKAPSSQASQTDQFVSLYWKTTIEDGVLTNVVGMLPGTGPETIIIGAHRDHFGRPGGILFPGADDNASGTAVILELARVLGKVDVQPKRTILFISFSGEERDMLGSSLYTSRPLVPLSSTKAMINIDHAGVGNGRLTVGVTGIEKEMALETGKTAGVHEKLDLYGFFPGGDHVPFKEAGVPTVTVVSGGVHPNFHQPSDTADTINPEILQTAAHYALALAWQLAYQP